MIRIFSCTTPFAIGEIWSNFQVSPKSIAYHPMKHSDRLCPGLGGHGGGDGDRRRAPAKYSSHIFTTCGPKTFWEFLKIVRVRL